MFRTLYERFTAGEKVEPAKPSITRRHFPSIYPKAAKLDVLKPGNPRRMGTAGSDRYELLAASHTVGEALDLGCQYADIDFAVEKGYVSATIG